MEDGILTLLGLDSPIERRLALKSKSIEPHHLRVAMCDEDPQVREEVVNHPKLTPELMREILSGDDRWMAEVLAGRPDLRPEELEFASNYEDLKDTLLKHPTLPKAQRIQLDPNGDTMPHGDEDFEDEDPWTQAKYRRGGEKEFERFLESGEGEIEDDDMAALFKAGPRVVDTAKFKTLDSKVTIPTLFRAYKNSPHHPVSLLGKYAVNRIENKELYQNGTPEEIKTHDENWLSHHKQGGAKDKLSHVTVEHLHNGIAKNPELIPKLQAHQKRLHNYLKKHCPEHIKVVNGEPSITLCRGYGVRGISADHSLSSYADSRSTASSFGSSFIPHWWVPLKNVWFSFMTGPASSTSNNFGDEDEYLVSNHPRIESKEPIQKILPRGVHGFKPPDAIAWNVSKGLPIEKKDMMLASHSSEPSVLTAVAKSPHIEQFHIDRILKGPNKHIVSHLLANPALTEEHLGHIFSHFEQGMHGSDDYGALLSHPKVSRALVDRALKSPHVPDITQLQAAASDKGSVEQFRDAVSKIKPGNGWGGAYGLSFGNLSPEKADFLISHHSPQWNESAINSDNLTADQISKLIDNPFLAASRKSRLLGKGNATDKHLDAMLDRHLDYAPLFLEQREFTKDQLNKTIGAIGEGTVSGDLVRKLVQQKALTKEHTDILFDKILSQHEQSWNKFKKMQPLISKAQLSSEQKAELYRVFPNERPGISSAIAKRPDLTLEDLAQMPGKDDSHTNIILYNNITDAHNEPGGNAVSIDDKVGYMLDHFDSRSIVGRAGSNTHLSDATLKRIYNHDWAGPLTKAAVVENPQTSTESLLEYQRQMEELKAKLPTLNNTEQYNAKDEIRHLEPVLQRELASRQMDLNAQAAPPKWDTEAHLASLSPHNQLIARRFGWKVNDEEALLGPSDIQPEEVKKSIDIDAWLKNLIKSDSLQSIEDHLGKNAKQDAIIEAAEFLSGMPLDMAAFASAYLETGDEVQAAIQAAKLPEGSEEAIQAVIDLQELNKSDTQYHVVGLTPTSKDMALEIQNAIDEGKIETIKLGGKHSKGSLLVEGEDHFYLLKSGSGKLSPAAGIRDEKASASKREAAFYRVARSWGIKELPRTELISVNGREFAAIQMLGVDWQNLARASKDNPTLPQKVLKPYLESGQLFKWAVLDAVLGSADRHSNNIMVSGKGEVALIDHGTTFSAESFNPSEKNSFIPGYLRAFSLGKKWHAMTSEEKFKAMPKLPEEKDRELAAWIQSIDPKDLQATIAAYGINPGPSLKRLEWLKDNMKHHGSASEVVCRFWSA